MKWITEVELQGFHLNIGHNDNLLFAGSCFAESVGSVFLANKFNAMVNPYGVLYNPVSVLQMLRQGNENTNFCEKDLVFHNDLWHSFAHHGSFSNEDKTDLQSQIEITDKKLRHQLQKTNVLFITWGTSWVYRHIKSDRVVANCHKIPSREFTRYRLACAEIVALYTEWLSGVLDENRHLKVVLTVSPVRHLKDSAHGNQLSKAVLLLAAEELCQKFENVIYFPSYEIMLDELRDYRFYNEDLIHPNNMAVQYIWNKLAHNCFDESTKELIVKIQEVSRAARHRPFNSQTELHQKFITNTLQKINRLMIENAHLDFTDEIKLLTDQKLTK